MPGARDEHELQGAGKTTLVNYILTQQKEWRICIIENEFGEVNIDEGLVQEQIKSKEVSA